jgi:alkylation response protein AidB-like acyl-CoA dehydrogenase
MADANPAVADGPPEAVRQPDTRGLDFFHGDEALQALLDLYLPAAQAAAVTPHLARLGRLVGTDLDDWAHAADRNPPVLKHRDRQGGDRQRIETHPAYREMERLAFEHLRMAAMSHGPCFGLGEPVHPVAKYSFQYLFAQAEFGLLCPVSMTDALTRTLRRFADRRLLDAYLPGLLAERLSEQLQGAMFMTEHGAGSDVGATETRAVQDGTSWRLTGDKWFCSNTDADLALVLARPEGAQPGTRGLSLFLMPRVLPDGTPNAYRIVRLKEKLGTRSMASGEIRLKGARAWLVGEPGQGFKQMAEMINQSRLSNAARSAGLMRRALHEARTVARQRHAFGRPLQELPVLRRQLLKIQLPAEQGLSMTMYTAEALQRADAGDPEGLQLRRILTPLVKFRTCRDARAVAGDAMELRGGSGYIEEWIEPRLLRDAHLGSIWEGTSNVVALDVLRAARKEGAHDALAAALQARMAEAEVPEAAQRPLRHYLVRAADQVGRLSAHAGTELEEPARAAASALYNAASACLLAIEGTMLSQGGGDARRLLLAAQVVRHRLAPQDPMAAAEAGDPGAAALLAPAPVPRERALAAFDA